LKNGDETMEKKKSKKGRRMERERMQELLGDPRKLWQQSGKLSVKGLGGGGKKKDFVRLTGERLPQVGKNTEGQLVWGASMSWIG